MSSTEFAPVAEILGDVHGGLRREPAHRRAFVPRRDDSDRQRAISRQGVVEKFAHLAAAFADERDDHGAEIARAREHCE